MKVDVLASCEAQENPGSHIRLAEVDPVNHEYLRRGGQSIKLVNHGTLS